MGVPRVGAREASAPPCPGWWSLLGDAGDGAGWGLPPTPCGGVWGEAGLWGGHGHPKVADDSCLLRWAPSS